MRTLFFAVTLIAASAALADDDVPGCDGMGSQIETADCVAAAYKKVDSELNAAWKTALASIDQADYMPADTRKTWKETLVTAQKAWVTFKDADCGAVAYEWWGGSGANLAETACLYGHTARRLGQLQDRYGDR